MTVRVGFIGTGGIAISHLTNLLSLPEAEVVALCDRVPEQIDRARQAVNAAGATPDRRLGGVAYTDYQAMLRDEQLDAVYLCLPPFAHGEPEQAVIAAGLPFLVEKPLALDLRTAAATLRQIRERDLLTTVGYQLRYSPLVARVRELLADTTLGMVVALRFGPTPNTPWYRQQAFSGGQLVEMATHEVDLLRYLAGDILRVQAVATTRINQQQQPDYDIFDANAMSLVFASGAIGSFANNFLAWPGAIPQLQGLHFFADQAIISLAGQHLRIATPTGVEELTNAADPMATLDQTFVKAVATGQRDLLLSDYADAVRTLAVTLAGERAARTGQAVLLPHLLAEVDL